MKHKLSMLLLLISIITQAQTQTLTLKQALQYALDNKAESKKAKLQVENSEYQIDEVRSMALPQVSLNAGLTNNLLLPETVFALGGQQTKVTMGQKWNSSATINLTQNLFNQSVFTGLRAAKTTREFYQINQQLTEEQLIEKVANCYYQVYVFGQKLKLTENNLASTQKIREVIKGQFDAGLARKIDLDRITVKVSNLEAAKQQLTNAVMQQENALKFFIGMPIQTQISLPNEKFEVGAEAFAQEIDLTKRTELALLNKQKDLYYFQKKSFEADYYPTLQLTGAFGYMGFGQDFPWFQKPNGAFWTSNSNIGLSLKIPVFNGFNTVSKVRKAEIDIKKTQEDINDAMLGLQFSFENAKNQINNSLINIRTQKENVKLAEEVLANTKNNYIQGLATLTELLDAENALADTQNNYTAAMLEYKLAEIQIIKSRGELRKLLN